MLDTLFIKSRPARVYAQRQAPEQQVKRCGSSPSIRIFFDDDAINWFTVRGLRPGMRRDQNKKKGRS